MSRNIGTFNFAANFEGLIKAPIDAKQWVCTYADLTASASWCASGSVWLYPGAIVAVGCDSTPANNGIYWLCANDYTQTCNWIKSGSGSGTGTITGATNGLSTGTTAVIKLGGALCENTVIDGVGNNYEIQFDNLCGFLLGSCSGVMQVGGSLSPSGTTTWMQSGSMSIVLDSDIAGTTGMTISGGPTFKGAEYDQDYSSNYGLRSIPDVGYVNSIASGLLPKAAAVVATTGNTTLSGLTTIDGVTLTAGMRVLVKNQINGALNGVYVAGSNTWNRSSDMDFTPSGETVSGSYLWVLSGNTNANTAWVLTTPDPIVSGDTLTFVLFAHVSDVIAGPGIDVTMSGGTHIVSLNTNSQAVINSAVTGATNGICKYDGRNICLDTNYQQVYNGAITGATNGLTKVGRCVILGGNLTGDTYIALQSLYKFAMVNGSPTDMLNIDSLNDSVYIGTELGNSICAGGGTNSVELKTNSYNSVIRLDNSTIILSGTSVNLIGGVTLSTPATGVSTDDILVWNSVDKCVKIVSGTAVLTSAITGATNGLSKSGQIVRLGGNLTGQTVINTLNNSFYIQTEGTNGYGFMDFSLNTGYTSSAFALCSRDPLSSQKWAINANNTTINMCHVTDNNNCGKFCVSNSGTVSTSTISGVTKSVTLGANALCYGANYCSCFVARSIPDVAWVTGYTQSAVTGFSLTYNNGLTKQGQVVSLGGLLTGNTRICGTNGGNYVYVDFNKATSTLSESTAGGNIILSSACNAGAGGRIFINALSGATYCGDYSANFVDRTLVDKGYVDNKMNVITVRCTLPNSFPSPFNLVSTDSFIGVTGYTSISYACLNLVPSPSVGQKVIVSDIQGQALCFPITIDGNGKCINSYDKPGACGVSTINTDYGSITFVFNGMFWSAVGFVN